MVIGASFIGLEAAASLRAARASRCTVVAPDDRPLGRVLGPDLGDFVRALHEEHGVIFQLADKPAAIDGRRRYGWTTASARRATWWWSASACARGWPWPRPPGLRGSTTACWSTSTCETSAPGIFAAGDIARWPDRHSGERIRVEHWVVAERQGQSAARNILGSGGEPFDAVPFFWSQHYDVSINYVGHAVKWDAAELSGSLADRDAAVTFRAGGRVAAVATVFRDKESLEAELAMERE